jgi:hypothetical protein
MPSKLRSLSLAFLVFGAAVGFPRGARKTPSYEPAAQGPITCRAVESKTAATLGVELVLFHHAESPARLQLS